MGSSLIGQVTQVLAGIEDQSWLGSEHGTNSTESITLDPTTVVAVFTDGVIPAGVVLGKITATGLYGPYDDGAHDGREVARGHLFTAHSLIAPIVGATAKKTSAALFVHGKVVESKLPTNHGLDAAAKADLTQIRYL